MTNEIAKTETEQKTAGLVTKMADRYGLQPRQLYDTICKTLIKGDEAKPEHINAFLVVANEYGLNPFTKEIYAFPAKGGGIQPVVGVDGWVTLINSNPQSDGFDFVDSFDDKGNLTAVTCRMYRKDRSRPIETTEYMNECKRSTDPWKQWPARMLRHKALIQCARYAFGFAGIVDPDEAERAFDEIDVTPPERAERVSRLKDFGNGGDAIDIGAEKDTPDDKPDPPATGGKPDKGDEGGPEESGADESDAVGGNDDSAPSPDESDTTLASEPDEPDPADEAAPDLVEIAYDHIKEDRTNTIVFQLDDGKVTLRKHAVDVDAKKKTIRMERAYAVEKGLVDAD